MSAPFKFKLKVKTGGGAGDAAPTSSQPSAVAAPQQRGHDQFASASHQRAIEPGGDVFAAASQPAAPAPSKPFKLKLKVANGARKGPAAQAEEPQQPPQWDAPLAPPISIKREASAAGDDAGPSPAPPPIKKIKLSTGKPAAVPLAKKPVIKFKPPPKQPRDAAAAAALEAAAGAADTGGGAGVSVARPSTLPIVRLTLPTVGPVGGGGGGPKRPKPKGSKAQGPRASVGVGVKKAKGKVGRPPARSPEAGGKRPKRSRSDLKELRDLGVEDLSDDFDEFDVDLDSPVAPRTFTLRSSHAAAAAAPSSTGLGLSTGAPAPSDARTGASGGAAVADTAGTEAPAEFPLPPQLPPLAPGPAGPPKKEDFERLLARCQKKDVQNVFKEPVTEAIAPGYFSVVKQPMDFGTMRTKAQQGEYATWEALRADMRLMFTNALTYNAAGSPVHNYAKLLMGQCDRIVDLAMQGKTDFRSSAMITRKHNAAVRAAQRAEREVLRQKARAEQRAAQEAKVLKKAGLASSYDEHEDENIRNSYRRPIRDANVARWKGLGAGSSTEGVAWGTGRQVLRPVNPWLPPGMYALSLARFAANLTGKARDLVLRRALASTAADEAAERALQQELAKKVPVPPPPPPAATPAPAPSAAGSMGGTAGQAGNRLPTTVGLQQQPSAMQVALGAASAAAGSAAAVSAAPAAMLAQQQLMMQVAAAGKPPGMMGMPPGMMMRPPGQAPPGLPPGASITLMATAQGMVPFLIQPGQPPIMMMAPGMQSAAAGGQKGASGTAPGMPPVLMPPGFQHGFLPGMQPAMRPKQ